MNCSYISGVDNFDALSKLDPLKIINYFKRQGFVELERSKDSCILQVLISGYRNKKLLIPFLDHEEFDYQEWENRHDFLIKMGDIIYFCACLESLTLPDAYAKLIGLE